MKNDNYLYNIKELKLDVTYEEIPQKTLNEINNQMNKQMENIIYNMLKVPQELLENNSTSASTMSFNCSEDQFIKAMVYIKSLPPIAVKIEIFPQGYFAIKDKITHMEFGGLRYNNIPLEIIFVDDKLKYNQARIIYNDGSSKIIDILEVK